ncbi:MAG: cytochrome c family protein [Alphaproteobacteria bacterium]|nr:cytochrome c family protein [Alphaproteobacteria bacterium]
MDSWEWNKIIGAVLGTLIFVLVIGFATEALFESEKPAKEAYHVEGVVETASSGGTAAPAEEPMPDWGTVLPAADAGAGKATSVKCEQCHDLSKGGPNKIGPNLWGVVGRPRAEHPGFSYSGAMSADHTPWSFDSIFKFVKSPQSYVPGTKMSFAGLRSAQDRINLIAYLRTQSDSPLAIPAPAPAKPAEAPATPAPQGANGAAPAGSPTTTPTGTPATPPGAPGATPPGQTGGTQPKP